MCGEAVNTYFINCGYTQSRNVRGESEYWAEFWSLLDTYSIEQRTEYTDEEFCEALEQYRNQDIQTSILSKNPLVRMFAIVDRRIGKGTLQKVKETIDEQPEWLRRFYMLRLSSERS